VNIEIMLKRRSEWYVQGIALIAAVVLTGCQAAAVKSSDVTEKRLVIVVTPPNAETQGQGRPGPFTLQARIESLRLWEAGSSMGRTETQAFTSQIVELGKEAQTSVYTDHKRGCSPQLIRTLDGRTVLGKPIGSGTSLTSLIKSYDAKTKAGVLSVMCVSQSNGCIDFYASESELPFTAEREVEVRESPLPPVED